MMPEGIAFLVMLGLNAYKIPAVLVDVARERARLAGAPGRGDNDSVK